MNDYRRKKAYSKYFGCYIRCVKYVSDDEWYFVFHRDVDNTHVMRAKTAYSYFNWVNI